MFCAFSWPRYQVRVYRTIGPLVLKSVLEVDKMITSSAYIRQLIVKSLKSTGCFCPIQIFWQTFIKILNKVD